tara:strand:+ start:3131 stop:3796 length:666 start_codon:yes stop_codon:yes gene_type:complete
MKPIKEQIVQLLKSEYCSNNSEKILNSMLQQIIKGAHLSDKQKALLGRTIADSHKARLIAESTGWKEEYAEKYKTSAMIASKFHYWHMPYNETAESILRGKIPARKSVFRMLNCKHTKRAMAIYNRSPKIAIGEFVKPKEKLLIQNIEIATIYEYLSGSDKVWESKSPYYQAFSDKGGFTLGVSEEVRTLGSGRKRYKILAIGLSNPFYVEERFMFPQIRK